MPHPPSGLPPDPFTTGPEGTGRTPNPSDQDMACAVCAQVLHVAARESGETVGWLHIGELPGARVEDRPDHVAVPVRRDDVHAVEVCDFCSGPSPSWVLPTEEFEVDEHSAASKDWAACEVCARLIRKNRWPDLTQRSVRAYSAKYGVSAAEPRLVETLKAFHAQVREYQTGPIHRMEKGAALRR